MTKKEQERFELVQHMILILAHGVALKDKKQVRAITKSLSKEFGIDFSAIQESARA